MTNYKILKTIFPVKVGYGWNVIYDEAGEMQSVKVHKRVYLCLPGRRLIFRDGKYEGWYRP